MKKFAAVRTAYYKDQALTKDVKKNTWVKEKQQDGSIVSVKKQTTVKKSYKSAIAELEHVMRTGNTNSVNIFDEYTHYNSTVTMKNSLTPLDAYHKLKEKYKLVTGKKCRSDMNTLFEHVIVLSDEYACHLEKKLGVKRAHKEIEKCIREYCSDFSKEFGFTPIGFSTHLDEGHMTVDENGQEQFKRNFHCHALFFNYDFKNKKSNLKHLSKKGKDPKTGKTYELNPHFERMQTLLSEKFRRLGFERGISKQITKAEHLRKDKFIQKKQKYEDIRIEAQSNRLSEQINRVFEYFFTWLKSLLAKNENTELYAKLVSDSLLAIDTDEIRNTLEQHIIKNEESVGSKINRKIELNESINYQIRKKWKR